MKPRLRAFLLCRKMQSTGARLFRQGHHQRLDQSSQLNRRAGSRYQNVLPCRIFLIGAKACLINQHPPAHFLIPEFGKGSPHREISRSLIVTGLPTLNREAASKTTELRQTEKITSTRSFIIGSSRINTVTQNEPERKILTSNRPVIRKRPSSYTP